VLRAHHEPPLSELQCYPAVHIAPEGADAAGGEIGNDFGSRMAVSVGPDGDDGDAWRQLREQCSIDRLFAAVMRHDQSNHRYPERPQNGRLGIARNEYSNAAGVNDRHKGGVVYAVPVEFVAAAPIDCHRRPPGQELELESVKPQLQCLLSGQSARALLAEGFEKRVIGHGIARRSPRWRQWVHLRQMDSVDEGFNLKLRERLEQPTKMVQVGMRDHHQVQTPDAESPELAAQVHPGRASVDQSSLPSRGAHDYGGPLSRIEHAQFGSFGPTLPTPGEYSLPMDKLCARPQGQTQQPSDCQYWDKCKTPPRPRVRSAPEQNQEVGGTRAKEQPEKTRHHAQFQERCAGEDQRDLGHVRQENRRQAIEHYRQRLSPKAAQQ